MSQYVRPGSNVPITVNDVVLITTPSGTQEFGQTGQTPYLPQTLAYVHTQGSASSSWLINHNLDFYPNITVQDSAGNIVEGEISYTNLNSLTVSFASAFSGTAYLS
jgi:hypothetical protein